MQCWCPLCTFSWPSHKVTKLLEIRCQVMFTRWALHGLKKWSHSTDLLKFAQGLERHITLDFTYKKGSHSANLSIFFALTRSEGLETAHHHRFHV
jgi:hypothetical protein